jgi:methyl-accepting chemotaxis protein
MGENMKLVTMFRTSLQAKLLGSVAGAFLAVVVFVAVYFPSRINSLAVQNAQEQVRTLSDMLAFSVGAGLDEGNFDLVQTAFQWAKKDTNVACVFILDESNSVITEFNPRKIDVDLKRVLTQREPVVLGDQVTISAPAVYKSKNRGSIVLVYSLESQRRDVFLQVLQSIAVLALLTLAGMTVVFRVTRGVIGKIKAILAEMNRFAGGDLEVQLQVDRQDEIGQLCEGFNTAVVNVGEIVGDVMESSAAVASASSEISSSTEEMAAGAQEQTAQSAEVSSAVEEMSKTIVENSRVAGLTASKAKNAKETAADGAMVVGETVRSMKEIAETVKTVADTVQELGKSSQQIGEIVTVIDEIADQTNLLALNAAIEAARAGDQGRGFAVVADEVRKLAERTTKATKEIASMIKKIQDDTIWAVGAIEEGTIRVDKGIELADNAGASLSNIVQLSQDLTDMVSSIASASEEQSSASEQISKNVVAISTVTSQTASGTQQIARAAEDLNHLTEDLQQKMNRFRRTSENSHARSEERRSGHKRSSTRISVGHNGKLIERR